VAKLLLSGTAASALNVSKGTGIYVTQKNNGTHKTQENFMKKRFLKDTIKLHLDRFFRL
jgi:hypothetical protein